jgi:leucyl-tRNA synthetase
VRMLTSRLTQDRPRSHKNTHTHTHTHAHIHTHTHAHIHTHLPLLQVNGKVRGTIEVAPAIDQEGAVAEALANPNVSKFLEGKAIKKVIFVQGKILNLIVA